LPSTSPSSSDDANDQSIYLDTSSNPSTPTEAPLLSPEFRAPPKLNLRPTHFQPSPVGEPSKPPPSAAANNDDNYIYVTLPVVPHDWNLDGLTEKLKVLEPKPEKTPPTFKANPFGSLFARSSRSKTSVPDSVLHQYPTERKARK